MKIQAGKTYLTRGRRRVAITDNPGGLAPFRGFFSDGNYGFYSSTGRHTGLPASHFLTLVREAPTDDTATDYIRLWNTGRIALPSTTGDGFDILRHSEGGARMECTTPTLRDLPL